MSISYDGMKNENRIHLKGQLSHTIVQGTDVFGNITRIDNVIDGIAGELEKARTEFASSSSTVLMVTISMVADCQSIEKGTRVGI